ncbi:MAG: AraC family transcriptional regulator [Treponema sp.]|uniref:helix-turn-helix transcriptional regulator n=1 Tax=Treponema sp. TaxID=166 RepID=UPI00298E8D96|nr:AraC family transcriptional regulator [Treponema sp.]MCQ2601707.1 AraC family transcriptional regulator [Treponema sp.]
MTEMEKKVAYYEYLNIEDELFHAPYGEEYAFYRNIVNGETEKIREHLKTGNLSTKKLGKLSDNEIQHFKYHFVISVALISRYCIERGMNSNQSYSLSDFYIQQADKCKTVYSIEQLLTECMTDYSDRMKLLRKKTPYSKTVKNVIDYIYRNLHKKIRVAEIASYIEKNESYLSKLFIKETGISITDYIINSKIDSSAKLLLYSDYTIAQIVEIHAFTSQSYFTSLFKQKYNLTPRQYRLRREEFSIN